jgi:hypothetical protein
MPHQLIAPDTWTIRQQVMRKYGGVCVCPCGCGSTNLRHLQLHHVNGGGTKEREVGLVRGKNLYIKLMANPVDPNLHPLCVACHWEATMFGVCENTPLSVGESKKISEVVTGDEVLPEETSVVTGDTVLIDPSVPRYMPWSRKLPWRHCQGWRGRLARLFVGVS